MDEKKTSLIENRDPESPDRLTEESPWEGLFDSETVMKAKTKYVQQHIGNIRKFWNNSYDGLYYPDKKELDEINYRKPRRSYYGADSQGLYSDNYGNVYYEVSVEHVPSSLDDEWNKGLIHCSCRDAQNGKMCVHEAALIRRIELANGGRFMVTEDDYDYRRRQEHLAVQKRRSGIPESVRRSEGSGTCVFP